MISIPNYLPNEIEKRSFEIINEELKGRGIVLPKENEAVVKRVIHASADFEYVDTLTFSENAAGRAKELLLGGADIVTDTNMAYAGINKTALSKLGGEIHCYMADEEIIKQSKTEGQTRAYLSMRKAAAEIHKDVIFVIGNAPTALISLYEMMEKQEYRPAFVIGVPVGFVNVEASKELIVESDLDYIVNRGRKGGSNIAAAICNALLYSVTDRTLS